MSKLEKPDREFLWAVLQERTNDRTRINSVIRRLNSVGAIDDCLREARDIVAEAWNRLDAVVKDRGGSWGF